MATPLDERGVAIIEAVDRERKRAATRALDVSLNELADMYSNRELKIRPEFQRLFRWSRAKQSQLIESLILEMPIPPIFVIETEPGTWELIDGLQRLSTYLHFRGVLDAPECDPPITPGDRLTLEKCDIIRDLDHATFEDLPVSLQIRLKRSFFRVEVVRKETNPRFRYYMFKRLNTGGEKLEEQEVRNCTVRLLGDEFNDFIIELSKLDVFKECIHPLTREKRRRMGDVELVLRFFAFKNNLDEFRHDVGPFMTQFMERVTDREAEDAISFDYTIEKDIFVRSFTLLDRTLGKDTCKRWLGAQFGGGFSNHHFEAFSVGTARVVDSIDLDLEDEATVQKAREKLEGVKKNPGFRRLSQGGGQNSPGPYRKKIAFVAKALRNMP